MDLLAHAVYGATVCSRTGLAGGSQGAPGGAERPWIADWTVWCAVGFGLLPDAVSMGLPWLSFWSHGMEGNFFLRVDDDVIVHYRYAHSLIVAMAAAGLLRLLWRPLGIPSLAWALHVGMDALTHGAGRFQTTVFYPLSTWSLDSIHWWQHPRLVMAYWLLLPTLWYGLWVWRRRARRAGIRRA